MSSPARTWEDQKQEAKCKSVIGLGEEARSGVKTMLGPKKNRVWGYMSVGREYHDGLEKGSFFSLQRDSAG